MDRADRYVELGSCYYAAARTPWHDRGNDPVKGDELIVPASCLGLAVELFLKALLIHRGLPEKELRGVGHDLLAMWRRDEFAEIRADAELDSESWTYPDRWRRRDTNWGEFKAQFEDLGRKYSNRNEIDGHPYLLRYPETEEIQLYPPEFLIEAFGSVLGMINGRITS